EVEVAPLYVSLELREAIRRGLELLALEDGAAERHQRLVGDVRDGVMIRSRRRLAGLRLPLLGKRRPARSYDVAQEGRRLLHARVADPALGRVVKAGRDEPRDRKDDADLALRLDLRHVAVVGLDEQRPIRERRDDIDLVEGRIHPASGPE